MKEYLFRGKRKDNGEWVYGYYVNCADGYEPENRVAEIVDLNADRIYDGEYNPSDVYQVIPETVGMYIQRACYNLREVKIFEGDIIEVSRRHKRVDGVEEPSSIVIAIDEHSVTEFGLGRCFPQDTICVIKVIGNVHDNPELVGEKTAQLYKRNFCLEGGR